MIPTYLPKHTNCLCFTIDCQIVMRVGKNLIDESGDNLEGSGGSDVARCWLVSL